MNDTSPSKLKHIIDKIYIDEEGDVFFIDIIAILQNCYVEKYRHKILLLHKEKLTEKFYYIENIRQITKLSEEEIVPYLRYII
jgi:hypothetical protein